MKKWLHKIFFSILLSLMVFSLTNFILKESILNPGEKDIIINVSSSHKTSIQISYNLPPSTVGTKVFEIELVEGKNTIKLPILNDIYIEKIYFFTEDEFGMSLNSFELNSRVAFKEFELETILNNLRLLPEEQTKYSKRGNILKENNSLKINFTDEFSVLFFNSDLCTEIYNELNYSILFFSYTLGFIGFICSIILFLFYHKRILSPSLQINICASFICLLFIPFLSQKENRTPENRVLAAFPDLNVNIWKIPSRYTTYYNDRFPFRNYLNNTYNYLIFSIFKVSPVPDFVQIGKDGWLFYSTKEIKKVYRGIDQYTNEELEKIRKKLELTSRELSKRGIDFYLMIPPLKHTVYPEFLPNGMKRVDGGITKREQIMNYLKANTKLNIIDPYPVLIKLKDSTDAYYKTDTHWNKLGAFRVYQQSIKLINKSNPEVGSPLSEKDFIISTTENPSGDLGEIINLKNKLVRKVFLLDPKFEKQSGVIKLCNAKTKKIGCIYYQSESLKDKPRLLMYRDSFTEYLHPYLSEHFSYSCYVWSHEISLEKINKDKPDIVILEIMERFVDKLL